MLLLEEWFFFADAFCECMDRLARLDSRDPFETIIDACRFSNPADIGNLMEAIHGIRLSGFIGDVYRKFPFPTEPEGFKQKAYGRKNQAFMKKTIASFAGPEEMRVMAHPAEDQILLGEYRFSRSVFHELVQYVWRGGYPRWKDEERPDYVMDMKGRALSSAYPLFEGLTFPD